VRIRSSTKPRYYIRGAQAVQPRFARRRELAKAPVEAEAAVRPEKHFRYMCMPPSTLITCPVM